MSTPIAPLSDTDEALADQGFAEPAPSMVKRCPCVLVVDTSGSMTGVQDQLNTAIEQVIAGLANTPHVAQVAEVAVVTFNTTATTVRPLSRPQIDEALPTVVCGGGTAYGPAIEAVEQILSERIHGPRPDDEQVVRPVVFWLTDGLPGDRWQDAMSRLRAHAWEPSIFAFGYGQVDATTIGQVSNVAGYQFDQATSEAEVIRAFAEKFVGTVAASATGRQLTADDIRPDGATTVPAIDLTTF